MTIISRTLRLSVVAALAAAAIGPAAPVIAARTSGSTSGATSAGQAEPVLPPGWSQSTEQPGQSPEQRLSEVLRSGVATPQQVAALQIESVVAPSAGLTSFAAAVAAAGGPTAEATAVNESTDGCPTGGFGPGWSGYVLAVMVRDLDTDGLDEIVTVRKDDSTAPGTVELEARRAADNRLLWSKQMCETTGAIGAWDVDGDGSLEVLTFDVQIKAWEPGGYPWHQTLQVLDAATGSLQWERRIVGQGPPWPSAGWDASDLVVDIQRMPDAGGTSGNDVFVGLMALETTFYPTCRESRTGLVLDGTSGSDVGRIARSTVNADGCWDVVPPDIAPIEDVSGDNFADFIALGNMRGRADGLPDVPNTTGLALTLEAATLSNTTLWSQEMSSDHVALRPAHLDGPDLNDVFLYRCEGQWNKEYGWGYCRQGPETFTGLNGVSGVSLWQRGAEPYVLAGDLDGDGGEDFRNPRFDWNYTTIHMQAWSGAEGTSIGPVFTYTASRPDGGLAYAGYYLKPVELTGDLTSDLVFASAWSDPDTPYSTHLRYSGYHGSSHAHLWDTQPHIFDPYASQFRFVADMNGNGTEEVVMDERTMVMVPGESWPRESTVVARVFEGSTLSDMMTATLWRPHRQFLMSVVAAKVDPNRMHGLHLTTSNNSQSENAEALFDDRGMRWAVPRHATQLTLAERLVRDVRELTATLSESPGGPPAAGRQVVFDLDGREVATAVTNTSGVATVELRRDARGTATARFVGDAAYLASNS